LTEDEKELGVCLIDIGGGTSDIAIFSEGAIRHTAVIPIAGDQVTNDIAVALRTPTSCAEEIKMLHGCALTGLANIEENVDVPTVGERPPRQISRRSLADVIEPRYEELFSLIQAELRRSGYEDVIASGIVLTGGSAKMSGVIELAEEIFHLPVRLGYPQQKVKGLAEIVENPLYATGVGLLTYGHSQQAAASGVVETRFSLKKTWGRMKNWFQGSF
jgi:cell division protein FtsA